MTTDAKQCPWCERWCLKDDACNYIFACGLQTGGGQASDIFTNQPNSLISTQQISVHSGFIIGAGCGRSWCWSCGKKFCGVYINPLTGEKSADARESHNSDCCCAEPDFCKDTYCPGEHNSHCAKRW